MRTAIRETEEMLQAFVQRGTPPVPLKAITYDVEIVSALAVVTQKRVFRNEETIPIEATMTFPVGYDAVVVSVKAIVDGRRLVGIAKAKQQARATYEKALDDGKAAVLHEELLRGLHMISVGNVAPGAEIVVETVSVAPLQIVSGKGRLRIPLTVGAVYGASPFLPSDDLVTRSEVFDAGITVNGASEVTVNGHPLADVKSVKTSYVIDIEVGIPAFHPVTAKTAQGEYATITFVASKAGLSDLAVKLLLDASGSMRTSHSGGKSNWTAMCEGLITALRGSDIRSSDSFEFWTFSNRTTSGGRAKGRAASDLVPHLPMEGGGTRIGEAVHNVASKDSNVLLVTDGRSYDPIDFDFVKQTGSRFTVVLIGSSSLDAKVAQLAAVSGGQLFITPEPGDVAGTVAAALATMRGSASPIRMRSSRTEALSRTVGGLDIVLSYSDSPTLGTFDHPAAAAYAAWLGVQTLDEATAAQLAEKEGIATHLTSIVLVDEQGETLDEVAVTRKIALSNPVECGGRVPERAMLARPAPGAALRASYGRARGKYPLDKSAVNNGPLGLPKHLFEEPGPDEAYLYDLADEPIEQDLIDWNRVAEDINLGRQPEALLDLIATLSGRSEIKALAEACGIPEWKVVVAVAATREESVNRTARRLWRRLLGVVDEALLSAAKACLPA